MTHWIEKQGQITMARKPFATQGDIETLRQTSDVCSRLSRDLSAAGIRSDRDVSELIEALATLIEDASITMRQCVYITRYQSMRGK